jgi:hypothetical protein
MSIGAIRGLFWVAAVYDGILGMVFLAAAPAVFRWVGVAPPNHFGYVHFPAALLVVFALMFVAIARDPVTNRRLIGFGMLLKLSYCAVVAYHWLTAGVPFIWKPFAVADLVFLVLFALAYAAVNGMEDEAVQRSPD